MAGLQPSAIDGEIDDHEQNGNGNELSNGEILTNWLTSQIPKFTCQKQISIVIVVIAIVIVWLYGRDQSHQTDYKLVNAEVRNIIFVGRGRTGKTTLINVLKDRDYNPPPTTVVRDTINASFQSFTIKSKKLNTNLHINIMDTPGLFERSIDINDQRTNEIILDTIKKCIDMEITKINHVYFVMNLQHGLNTEDIKSFHIFSKLFIGIGNKISIIISRAQGLSTKDYEHYINQFKTIADLKPMYEKANERLLFLGAVAKRDMYVTSKLKKNVYYQRKTLFEHIIQQNTSFNVKSLNIYNDYLSFLKKIKNVYKDCCKSGYNCNKDQAKFEAFTNSYIPS
eukprot:298710_1